MSDGSGIRLRYVMSFGLAWLLWISLPGRIFSGESPASEDGFVLTNVAAAAGLQRPTELCN